MDCFSRKNHKKFPLDIIEFHARKKLLVFRRATELAIQDARTILGSSKTVVSRLFTTQLRFASLFHHSPSAHG